MTKRWLRWAVALATLAVLWWLLQGFDWATWWARLRDLPVWLWALVPVGMLLSYLCRAARIHAELRQAPASDSHKVTLWHCLRLSLVHNLAIHLVPMRGGELAYPALLQRELGVPLGSAMASLAWMRLQDALVLLAAAVLLAPLPWALRLGGLALAAGLLLGLLRWARAHAQGLIAVAEAVDDAEPGNADASTVRPRWTARLAKLWRNGLHAITDPSRHTARGWLYCGGNWAVKLAVIGAILAALTGLPPQTALRGALGGELAALSPVQGPSGLGTYEAGVWLGLNVAAGEVAAPLSVSSLALAALTAHALIFLTALVAGGLALLASARATRRPAGAF